jgi:hypothetical protein
LESGKVQDLLEDAINGTNSYWLSCQKTIVQSVVKWNYVKCFVFPDILEVNTKRAPQDKLACIVRCSKRVFRILFCNQFLLFCLGYFWQECCQLFTVSLALDWGMWEIVFSIYFNFKRYHTSFISRGQPWQCGWILTLSYLCYLEIHTNYVKFKYTVSSGLFNSNTWSPHWSKSQFKNFVSGT